jgi:hypothetical protein
MNSMMQAVKLKVDALVAGFNTSLNCKVGRTYPMVCEKGVPCNPVEGHFVTECETCNMFRE